MYIIKFSEDRVSKFQKYLEKFEECTIKLVELEGKISEERAAIGREQSDSLQAYLRVQDLGREWQEYADIGEIILTLMNKAFMVPCPPLEAIEADFDEADFGEDDFEEDAFEEEPLA